MAVLLCAAACGDGVDDNGNGDGGAPLGGVALVSCPGATPAATFTTPGNRFEPSSDTVSAGDVVRFDPSTGHDVASSQSGLFSVPLGGERCFRFDRAGSFGFRCTTHGFTGTLVVE